MFFKKTKIKTINRETELLDSVETWVVSWWRNYGAYSNNYEKRYQAFTCKKDAVKFKESINQAYKLIGTTYKCEAELHKQFNGL